jgi:hypothetical protein
MTISIRLRTIKCVSEDNESSASEEAYVLTTTVHFIRPQFGLPAVHNLRVERFGIWDDFDAGEIKLNLGNPIWGQNGAPVDITDPGDVVILASVMENDNGDPNTYRQLVETVASASLVGTIGERDNAVRADRLRNSIRDALNGVDVPIPFALDDDHIGTERLDLHHADLLQGGFQDKFLRVRSGEGDYDLGFRVTRTSFVVFGAIREHWEAQNAEAGPLGLPAGNEAPTFDGQGRAQPFQGGIISWHPTTGANVVWGLIGQRWLEIGREQFGYPLDDERSTPDGLGRYSHFRAVHLPGTPDASIYFHPNTGAHEVYGAIRQHWAGLGWERSRFGYPVDAEHNERGGRLQRFQGGALLWKDNAIHEI